MSKLALIVAMYAISVVGAVHAESPAPYPTVIDRTFSQTVAPNSTALTTVVVSAQETVFDVMRERRIAEEPSNIVPQPAVESLVPENTVVTASADVSEVPDALELPADASADDALPEVIIAADVIPTAETVDTIETAAAPSLFQPRARNLGGASGSDTLEPVALEERNDSPRTLIVFASDDAATINYERDAAPINQANGRLGLGFLFSEERDTVFTGNLMLDVQPLIRSVSFSAGLRAYAALLGQENQDVVGLGFGAEATYQLPVSFLPLVLRGGLFYTPDVFVFGNSDRIIDYNVHVGFQLRESLHAFAGLRFLRFDTRPGDREVDDNIHIGLRWDFAR